MQAPWYKTRGPLQHGLLEDFSAVVDACAAAKINTLVLPLVDDGALETTEDQAALKTGLDIAQPILARNGMQIAFECDLAPDELREFIADFPQENYGLTYDMGNSAALGFDPEEEFRACGDRITHVHIKDRPRGGSTVPLGEGDTRFAEVFRCLAMQGYRGDYILQTARSDNDDHAGVLAAYREQSITWINEAWLNAVENGDTAK
jgi:hexulose-6-phosphate isomerase